MNIINTLASYYLQIKVDIHWVFLILGAIWLGFFLNAVTHYRLSALGIWPRKVNGLLGIFTYPFLHVGFEHVLFNSIPFLVLACFLLLEGVTVFFIVLAAIAWISGFLTWLFGRSGVHVGLSNVVVGLWSYLLLVAFYSHSALGVLIGFVLVYYFAGIFFGIFPTEDKVSWEGHLFGFITGIFVFYQFPLIVRISGLLIN